MTEPLTPRSLPRTQILPCLVVVLLLAVPTQSVAQGEAEEEAAEETVVEQEIVQEEEMEDEDALRAKAQNPIANLISLPFQNNTDFGIGPFDRTKNTLNIQPVVPFMLGEKINMINRLILPVIWQPVGESETTTGIGDANYQGWLSPVGSGGPVTWGLGAALVAPTGSKEGITSDKWSAGPSAVVVWQPPGWTAGFVTQNIWSFAGNDSAADVNSFLFQYFINYNLPNAWYLVSAPINIANWEAPSGERWFVPVGGGVGKVFAIGSQKINSSIQAYKFLEKPTGGPDWQLRVQLQFLFPKG